MSTLTGTAAPLLAFALALSACGGAAVPEPAAPPAPPAAPEQEADIVHKSSIEVYSKDGTEILVDGKSIGKAPIQKYELEPGPHNVTFVDETTGNRTMGVNLAPGDHQAITSDPPPHANNDMKPEDPKKKPKGAK
jgi:hypothetical protein